MDSLLFQVNDEHPFLLNTLRQYHIFDPQKSTPLKHQYTKEDGSFKFENLKPGLYNLQFKKECWGDVYRYSIEVSNDTSIDPATMYPLTNLPSSISSVFVFGKDHTYVIQNNTEFNSQCFFEGGSKILVNPSVRIEFRNQIISSNNPIATHFMLNSDGSEYGSLKWDGLVFFNNNMRIENLVVSDANTGITIFGSNCILENVIFRDLVYGVYCPSDYNTIKYCIFTNISSRAVVFNQSSGDNGIKHHILYSCFLNCNEGIRTMGQPVSITDNVFLYNEQGIISFSGYHIIEHNYFDKNKFAIHLQGSSVAVRQNEFCENEKSNYLSAAYYTSSGVPTFHENNFLQTKGYAIYILPHPISEDIDATHNYWACENIDEILYDKYDNPHSRVAINYMPKRNTKVNTAGVRLPEK